jgi:hypothetical protein
LAFERLEWRDSTLKSLRTKELSDELGVEEDVIQEELDLLAKEFKTKKNGKCLLFDDASRKWIVINSRDVQFIVDGVGKLSFVSLVDHFKQDVEKMKWLLKELHNRKAIDDRVFQYYTEVRNKPSVTAWFEPASIHVEEQTSLNIEIDARTGEVNEPKLEIIQVQGLRLDEKPNMPSKILRGKRVEKYVYTGIQHGDFHISINLGGVIDGVKYGSKEPITASLKIRAQPPKLQTAVNPRNLTAYFKEEASVKLLIENQGLGDAEEGRIEGLDKIKDFDILSGSKLGNLGPHGKTEFLMRLRPLRSGKFTFGGLVATYLDVEGNKFKENIPDVTVEVKTLEPELKTEFIYPQSIHAGQKFALTTRITNIGKGAAEELSFELPLDRRILFSGQISCSIARLEPGESEELIVTLGTQNEKAICLKDFQIDLRNVEGVSRSETNLGVTIPVRAPAPPPPPALAKWPFEIDNIIGGKYTIEAEIGEGGYAKVYLAEDNFLHTKTALKVLKPQFVADPEIVRLFIQEAKLTMDLKDESIVIVRGVEKETVVGQEFPYIVMEYMDGKTLNTYTRGKPMSLAEAVLVMLDVCRALSYAHQQKIIHCDIKPSNIFYSAEKNLWKLGDFGISKIAQKSEISNTNPGTVAYMAPEVLAGKPPTLESDIYSLGLVFKEMLTGSPKGDLSKAESIHKEIGQDKLLEIINLIERMTDRRIEKRPGLSEVDKLLGDTRTWHDLQNTREKSRE